MQLTRGTIFASRVGLVGAELPKRPHNIRGASVGSRHGSASGIADIAKVPEKWEDKAGFVACMTPFKHDHRENIMGFGGWVIVSALA